MAALPFVLVALTQLVGAPSFAPRIVDEESFAETYSVLADLEDGTYVQVQLAITNAGFGSKKGGCRLLVAAPGQGPVTKSVTVDSDEWRHTKSPEALEIGSCRIAVENGTTVQAVLDETAVELHIERAPVAIVPPLSGIKHESGHFYDNQIIIPWAKVRATLSLPGGKVVNKNGFAFADHSRATTLPKELARGWVRFRGLANQCSTVALVRFDERGAKDGWLFRQTSATPESLASLAATMPQNGKASPFAVKSGNRTLAFAPGAKLYRHVPTEEFGMLGKAVGAWVGKVETTTYRGTLDLGDDCGAVRGIMEISHID